MMPPTLYTSGMGMAALLLCLILPEALAAPVRSKTGVPTTIQSASMEYSATGQTVVFLGDVHVTRPDFELWSKKLTIYLKKKDTSTTSSSAAGGMEAGDVDHFVAEGAVRLKSEDRSGECEKATYFVDTDKVVMEGSPVLRDPDTTIRGTVITHFLEENRTQVGGVVHATFQAPDRTGPATVRQNGTASGDGR
jgi:lipopolysaccharide export system protein LptA